MVTFVKSNAPFVKKETSVKRMMVDVLIALLPLVMFSIYKFGWQALLRIVLAVVVMILVECAVVMIRHRPHPIRVKGFKAKFIDRFKQITSLNVITPTISAVIFSMMVPAHLSIYAVIISAGLGILFAKMVFGGMGANIFNPAAVAFIIALISFGAGFKYAGPDLVGGSTALGALGNDLLNIPNALKDYSLLELFLGNVPGGMGEISALLILISGAYLFIRKAADWRIFVAFLGSFVVLMLVAALTLKLNIIDFVLFQVLTGGVLFGAVFMATDPVTSPVTAPGRYIYGLLIGSLVVVIRLFGSHTEGVAFAILIANMFVPLIDYYKWSNPKLGWKVLTGLGVTILLMAFIVFVGLGGL
ncbi:MAG: RnfABCDGE type electron transport complex subunit D [Acholeplasmataceae bacterium]|jgi:electron transport complex protein RnfD|nr:RnfABCDGE type electron transport complex subunit D [Acholeplasmataceae bacterium]MCK9289325.1 RnfABCDGE type electron transport complex subunit D [Acholeplasmataceae bacterium]MCK9427788.1 RnfABCDGE type electron transport complex subunit D [Acholeplasmataceae bacterium]HHT39620.1 RnfABCDGE type electron transport complex subunit D [Acholeplasmataceae bacterium]